MSKLIYDTDTKTYSFTCPHCEYIIQVGENEFNCCIFRHGYFYEINQGEIRLVSQLPPHASKEVCEMLKNQNKIIGCGKPFQIKREPDHFQAVICDYI
jgi:hypothetical protein